MSITDLRQPLKKGYNNEEDVNTAFFYGMGTLCFSQIGMEGTWILDSYDFGSGRKTEVKDKLEKIKISFDVNGRYVKTYYEPDLPEGSGYRMTYSMVTGKPWSSILTRTGMR